MQRVHVEKRCDTHGYECKTNLPFLLMRIIRVVNIFIDWIFVRLY